MLYIKSKLWIQIHCWVNYSSKIILKVTHSHHITFVNPTRTFPHHCCDLFALRGLYLRSSNFRQDPQALRLEEEQPSLSPVCPSLLPKYNKQKALDHLQRLDTRHKRSSEANTALAMTSTDQTKEVCSRHPFCHQRLHSAASTASDMRLL